MRLISLIILVLVALLGFSFALLNSQMVAIDYYVGTKNLPLSVLLVAAFIVGLLFGMCLLFPSILRLKFDIRRLHRHREG